MNDIFNHAYSAYNELYWAREVISYAETLLDEHKTELLPAAIWLLREANCRYLYTVEKELDSLLKASVPTPTEN